MEFFAQRFFRLMNITSEGNERFWFGNSSLSVIARPLIRGARFTRNLDVHQKANFLNDLTHFLEIAFCGCCFDSLNEQVKFILPLILRLKRVLSGCSVNLGRAYDVRTLPRKYRSLVRSVYQFFEKRASCGCEECREEFFNPEARTARLRKRRRWNSLSEPAKTCLIKDSNVKSGILPH
jgi:hypothetical protein